MELERVYEVHERLPLAQDVENGFVGQGHLLTKWAAVLRDPKGLQRVALESQISISQSACTHKSRKLCCRSVIKV